MNKYVLPFLLMLASCQAVKTVQTKQETYPNGKTKTILTTIVRKNKEFELHENFREETRITREYYSNGKLKYQLKISNHNGMDYPCREALYELTQYDSTGFKRLYIKNECDCHKQTEITYNEKGKILTESHVTIKRLY